MDDIHPASYIDVPSNSPVSLRPRELTPSPPIHTLKIEIKAAAPRMPAPSLARPRFEKPHLHVDQIPSAFSGKAGASRWTNKGETRSFSGTCMSLIHTDVHVDIDPIRREDRKWGIISLIAYWCSDAFNAATWEFAASILAIGLSYKDSLGIVATAFILISGVIALNGAVGVLYHAPFPVLARASWGFWGSYGTLILTALYIWDPELTRDLSQFPSSHESS